VSQRTVVPVRIACCSNSLTADTTVAGLQVFGLDGPDADALLRQISTPEQSNAANISVPLRFVS
jgi:hypothetical protein